MSSRFIYPRLSPKSFWTNTSLYKQINESDFLNHNWQSRNTLNTNTIFNLGNDPSQFWSDVHQARSSSTMSIKLTPYLASLINWNDPYNCPIRKQFIPVQSTIEANHPMLKLDSLNEQNDSPVPGLIHRYNDKVLFLTTSTCPVYCRFCTRSYSIGKETELVEKKLKFIPGKSRFEKIYQYLEQHEEIEDVVVSGGDVYLLPAHVLFELGKRLLSIEHIRRIRLATKGLSVMPMKILTDNQWFESLVKLNQLAREQSKSVAIHTHINHPNEITFITKNAADKLYKANIQVRNQSVLLRGINDDVQTMYELIKYLSYMNIQPYYVYLHDMVAGAEEFRTALDTAIELEKSLRGSIAGFNMPQFIVDLPRGGGKRLVSSFEHYDRETGISIFRSPQILERNIRRNGTLTDLFFYFDPLRHISDKYRRNNDEQFIQLINNKYSSSAIPVNYKMGLKC
jgi:lysine 2,3-aminomutase